ncbi:maltodextrin-binding protein MdxE precursor [bacterium BMS3Abin15]|nr:maltodextrin-binding protein MdxE precursor [bacterium BMS3Abin15]HDZ85449.1 extracellular solute-binding protein [Candidatus Moranbacteria bacterium]
MSRKIKIIIAILITSSIFFISGCGKNTNYRVDLVIWGVFDDSDSFREIIKNFREINPHIGDIDYKKLTEQNYKQDLIGAMAAGNGPDIFLIHNDWLPSFKNKIEPISNNILGEQEFRQNFVDVAIDDFISEGQIYALPLSVDSLALYYNKDLFNAEGIASPPDTWEKFDEAVKKLTKIDQYNNPTLSGAAMGTAYNINRSTDILGLRMFQNGNQMINDKGRVTLNNDQGRVAMEYYTKFARSNSPLYTWNSSKHDSIDSFYESTAAMMINYSWHYSTVKSKNAKLNFAVAPVPQPSSGQPVNYANYWGFASAKGKSNEATYEAQQFLKFLTVKNNGKVILGNALSGNTKEFAVDFDPAKNYLDITGKPAARRDIIEEQKSDPILGPFAYGNLIAKSWYQVDPEENEKILAEAIDSVNKGSITIRDALKIAETRINQLMRK